MINTDSGDKKIISSENLTIGYPDKVGKVKIVKKNIYLSASKGELIALIGGNGAGKSTLLKTLAGFQPIISGKILIKETGLNQFKEKELARIMSFVSTEIIRVSNLTVYDLVALGRYPHTNWSGRLTDEDRSKVEEAIRMVGLIGYENRPINFISDGERQKTMIARTLAQDTDIILLDEPTAFLDLSNKYEIVHILHRLAYERGKTILFSTHDLSTAIAECDRIWLMLGDEVKEGSPEDLVLNGSFSSLFANKNLIFDKDKGDFRIVKQKGYKAMVKGEGTSYNWTVKALERIGYEIISDFDSGDKTSVLEIEILFNCWLLKNDGSELRFNLLYDLCRYLKNFQDKS